MQIAFLPMGMRYFFYNEVIGIDYSIAFDPYQPETGKLSALWTCNSWLQGCSNLKLSQNRLDPISLISIYKIVFGFQYDLNVTLTNPNVKFLKSVADPQTIFVNPPQTFGPPLSCLDFKLVFRNTSMPFNRVTSNEYEILFDNSNYTDIVITGTQISLNACTAALGHSNISATAFTQFNNRELFDDMRSHLFNSTPITITRARIQRSFIAASI